MEERQVFHIPLSAGLNTKGDKRSQDPPALDKCVDAEFDDVGGLRTRKPYSALGVNILGGGTLSNIRKLFANGDELCCFTDTGLYSWDVRDSAWVLRGTHLAVNVTEATRFATTDDQYDCDRAELSSTIVFAWTGGTTVYAAAIDKTTGAVIVGPTAQTASGSRPRLVACATKILLFYLDSGNLAVKAIDPANVGTSLAAAATSLAILAASSYYDVTRVIGADQIVGACRRSPTTAYTVFTVTAGLVSNATAPARTCDGPIAVSSTPDGLHVQVIRANGSAIQGDYITISTLADVHTAQAIGTAASSPVNQIAAAHRSVQNGGQNRCYAFWSSGENTNNGGGFEVQSNWVDTGGSLGTASALVQWVGIASRAFDYNGSIYFWAAFGQTSGLGAGGANATATGQFQNSYFLYRDDGFLAAKSVMSTGGGHASSTGHLPGVALTSGATVFSWCANIRRIIDVGSGTSTGATILAPTTFAMRAPRDVMFTFDSNEARRTARLGNTLYIAAGEVLQYDGTQLVEAGFHVSPWYFDSLIQGAGNIPNGTYGYKVTYRWQNSAGELDRSSTANIANSTVTGGPRELSLSTAFLPTTHKTANQPAVEIWRTQVNPPESPPYYLITSMDPSTAGSANGYIANSTTSDFTSTFFDNATDATIAVNASSPDNDGVLASMSPPAASLIIADEFRVFLAGVPGSPNTVWYSKQRNDGEVAAFNGSLTVDVPSAGGAVTGLAILNGTLIVFRENAIYALEGVGFDNTGGGTNYGPAQIISLDLGAVNQESIALVPEGGAAPSGLLFKSNRGWYVLTRGWGLVYVGNGVATYDSETPLSIQVITGQHQVRVATSNRVLVWDTLVNQWGEWSIANAVDSTMWNDVHYYATASAVMKQSADFSVATGYGMDIETAWFKPSGLVGQFKTRWIMPLGEYRSACAVRIRVARNYQSDGAGGWSYFDDKYRTPATVVGGPLQVRMGPSIPNEESIKVRITASSSAKDGTAPTGEAMKLTGIGLEIGLKPGLYKLLAQAQKV